MDPAGDAADCPAGRGEMAALIRSHDWAATPLGPMAAWPGSLSAVVDAMLGSGFPMSVRWGPDLIQIYNDAYRPIMGGRHPAGLGQATQACWPETWHETGPLFARVLAGESITYDDAPRQIARNGSEETAWFTASHSPLRDDDGQLAGALATLIETTERYQAEVRLRAAEAQHRQILDGAMDYAIIATDLDGRVTRWNEGARRILGWTERDMLGASLERVFTAEDVAAGKMAAELAAALTTGRGDNERWHLRRDGTRFWGSGEMTVLREAGGAAVGFVKVLRDGTEQRVADEALRQSEQRLAAALEIAAIGTFDWNAATGAVELSARSLEIFGLAATADVVGQEEILSRIVPEEEPMVFARTQAVLAEGGRLELEFRVIRADGTQRSVLTIADRVEDGAEAVPTRLFGVFGDVTDRRAAETILRDANVALEQRIASALAERTQVEEALRQSQKMEAVGQLTGGLAHDFNNLLTGIAGSLELLQTRLAQGRTTELERYLVAAQGSARRAAALTHRLLAFSRRQTLDPAPTDVNRLVAGMEELARRTMGAEIAVETVAAGGLWSTLVDPGQLENALLNLCINARDAMPGGGKLTIETANRWLDDRAAAERDVPPGQYVSLCVSDNGSGMPAEVAARAFDPFFTTKPIGMGTGLGLSMIYGFARQSGGQVRIYSEVGRGTMVCLYLPRHLGEANVIDPTPAAATAGRVSAGETVLVVDDEPTVRMLVAEVLEDLGYRAIEAADGAAALRLLQSDVRVDLLVTDVGLPGGMNGRQVADAARSLRAGLKVLFVTGYAENAVLSHGHLAPGMHVMTKPFAMDALAARITELIGGR